MGNKKKYKHHIKYNDFTDNEHWTQEEDPNRALPDAVLIIGRGLPGWLFRGRESPLPSALISNGARLLSMHVYPPLKTRRRTRSVRSALLFLKWILFFISQISRGKGKHNLGSRLMKFKKMSDPTPPIQKEGEKKNSFPTRN